MATGFQKLAKGPGIEVGRGRTERYQPCHRGGLGLALGRRDDVWLGWPMIHIHPWRRMPGVHSFEEFSEQLFLGIGWRPFRLVRFLRLLRPSAGATSKHRDVVAWAHPP